MFDILIPWERGPNALDSYKELCPFPPRLIPSMCTWPKPFRGSPHCIHRGAKGQRLRKIQEPQFSVSTSCLGVQRHCVQGWELTKPSGTQAGSTPPSSRSPSRAQLTSRVSGFSGGKPGLPWALQDGRQHPESAASRWRHTASRPDTTLKTASMDCQMASRGQGTSPRVTGLKAKQLMVPGGEGT